MLIDSLLYFFLNVFSDGYFYLQRLSVLMLLLMSMGY